MKSINESLEPKPHTLSGGSAMTSGETIYLNYRPLVDIDLGDNSVPIEEIVDPKVNEPVGKFGNSETPLNK